MKQHIFEIQSNEQIAKNVYRMQLGGDTTGILPGQFVNIRVQGQFLRRPISVCNVEQPLNHSEQPLNNALVERGETVSLPTEYGDFMLTPFRELTTGLEHIVLVKGEWEENEPILCRVHSSCMTGDIFASKRCECGEQLHKAMQMVEKEGKGIIVYMNQEGRGIGLMNKIRAYKLQEQGDDTVEANVHLGFQADERNYGVGAQILQKMGAHKLRLMTNNPIKRIGLESFGIEIVENIPIEIAPNPYNLRYMRTKKEKMHHNLNLV